MEVQAWAKAAAELPRTDGDDSESEVSDDRGHDEVHLARTVRSSPASLTKGLRHRIEPVAKGWSVIGKFIEVFE